LFDVKVEVAPIVKEVAPVKVIKELKVTSPFTVKEDVVTIVPT
jgi:hypothetical protein